MSTKSRDYTININGELLDSYVQLHGNSDFLQGILSEFFGTIQGQLRMDCPGTWIKSESIILSEFPQRIIYTLEGDKMPNDEFLQALWSIHIENEITKAEKRYTQVSVEIERLKTQIARLEVEQKARLDFLVMKRNQRDNY